MLLPRNGEPPLRQMVASLRSRPRDEEALKDEQIMKLKQKIGDLVTDVDILKEAMKPYRPTPPGMSDE